MLQEEQLVHYGVLGMKWGITRQQGSGTAIRSARSSVSRQKSLVGKAENDIKKAKTDQERQTAIETHAKLKIELLNNSDRVIAARLTRGEKVASFLLLTPVGATALIGATSATSRRIEYKQDKHKYDG